jgi:hypothetical protein
VSSHAAFLSIRREFIGKPLKVKRIFVSTANPLGRERYFEGTDSSISFAPFNRSNRGLSSMAIPTFDVEFPRTVPCFSRQSTHSSRLQGR